MLKNMFLKTLALCFVLSLAACDRNKDVDRMEQNETTSPHALEQDPVETNQLNDSNRMHDDMQNEASIPATIENDASGVQSGNSTTAPNRANQTPAT